MEKQEKAYKGVIEYFKNRIMAGELRPGEKLPPEREIAQMLEVSRNSVREALRIMDMTGVISSQQGSGNYITCEFQKSIAETMGMMFAMSQINYQQISQIRYALEQQAFALAIEQASESQMETLEELVKRLDRSMDEQENARIDKQIHFTLAQASGNVLLLNILEACSGVIDTFIRNMRAEILRTKEAKEALNLCHRQIAEALRNKDNAAGKDALDRHFRMIDEILEKNEKKQEKISVIIQNSDDSQWAAFKYGAKMAAADKKTEVFVVSTAGSLSVQEEENLIEREIANGASGIIVEPANGEKTEKMLKEVEKKVPVVLVESLASSDGTETKMPVTGADNYAMGKALAEELLKDCGGNIKGKKIGLVSGEENAEAISERAEGVRAVLEEKQADILWQISDSFAEDKEKNSMEQSEKVDFIMTLDNISLVAAGECSSTNNLHGAVLYGIGHSMEAFYYLDTGEIQCLVVPDEFNRGYQSVAELSDSLRRFMKKPERNTVSYSTVRRETLFSKENQEVLFTMSQ